MKSARLTIVVDNQAQDNCLAEHGFALWIDLGDRHILLDTGQGHVLAGNIQALGLDPKKLTDLVLSHGHYDHTGGLPWVYQTCPQIKLWSHPGITESRYSISNTEVRDIRMPRTSLEALGKIPESQVNWSTRPHMLAPGIGVTGFIPRKTTFEDTGGPFFLDPRAQRPDPIEDDQALWIQTSEGLIVCLGCCHAGLINTLEYIQELSGSTQIRAIIGGLHLGAASPKRLENTISALHTIQPQLLVPCHCTGQAAMDRLQADMNCPVRIGHVGLTLEFS